MRAQVGMSILVAVGILVASSLLFFSGKVVANFWGIIMPKEDAPTLESFKFLGQQLSTLDDGEQRQVPFHMAAKYYLASGGQNCPTTKLCLCKDPACDKIVEKGIVSMDARQFTAVLISGSEWKGVENLEIARMRNQITVRKIES